MGLKLVVDNTGRCENCRQFYSPGCRVCQERVAAVCGCAEPDGCTDMHDDDDDIEDYGDYVEDDA